MNFYGVLVVAICAVSAAQGCEELPEGLECPADGLAVFPDKEHCSKYWECYNGCANYMTCTKDHLYNEEKKWCEEPEKVYCGDRNCDSRPCADTPTNSTIDCSVDGYFPDPENCIKYYHCFGGEVAEHITCDVQSGKQLCYDPVNVWCNWCPDVTCGDRPICDTHDEECEQQTPGTTTTHKPTNCDKVDCSDDGFFAQGDCDRCFCECANQHAFEFCCEANLVFNPVAGTCDWPFNVPACTKA